MVASACLDADVRRQDSLERQAGVSAEPLGGCQEVCGVPRRVVAAHGNMDEAYVLGSRKAVDVEELRQAVFAGQEGWRELARRHGGLVRPGASRVELRGLQEAFGGDVR